MDKKLIVLLVLLLAANIFFNCNHKNFPAVTVSPIFQRSFSLVTVAFVDKAADGKSATVRFFEQQHPYELSSSGAGFEETVQQLMHMKENGGLIKVLLDSSNQLLRIATPSEAEQQEYKKFTGFEKITNTRWENIKVKLLDSTFDRVTDKIGLFTLAACNKKIVPNYATLVKIFNKCKEQACAGGGPYIVAPCIPFQYVRDGCYARAHKMRYIIEELCGYCSHKVFSFALGSDRLAVKANMVGGCCVTWWYHVAPIVPVKIGIFTFSYVIDPSMFTTPVLLSQWLAAQENSSCSSNANVTQYSIQPSSAFWPSGGPTSFGTDPNYQLTNQYLTLYKTSVTCP